MRVALLSCDVLCLFGLTGIYPSPMVCCVVCVVRVSLFWFVVGFEHSLVVLQFVYGLVKRLRTSRSLRLGCLV